MFGENIMLLCKRRLPKTSLWALADLLQLEGIDLGKNAIHKIEKGQRFVTDMELKAFARDLNTTTDALVGL